MITLMALLGKKDGGSRCIALIASVHRLLLVMMAEEIKGWDSDISSPYDTAVRGKSALVETAYRHTKAGALTQLGHSVAIVLWDVRKYFDSLDVPTLAHRAEAAGFPPEQLALAMQVHRSARVIRTEGYYSDFLELPAQSILAGCLTSTYLSKAFLGPVLSAPDQNDSHHAYHYG